MIRRQRIVCIEKCSIDQLRLWKSLPLLIYPIIPSHKPWTGITFSV